MGMKCERAYNLDMILNPCVFTFEISGVDLVIQRVAFLPISRGHGHL